MIDVYIGIRMPSIALCCVFVLYAYRRLLLLNAPYSQYAYSRLLPAGSRGGTGAATWCFTHPEVGRWSTAFRVHTLEETQNSKVSFFKDLFRSILPILSFILSREMDCSTTKCYSSDWNSYLCPQDYKPRDLTNWAPHPFYTNLKMLKTCDNQLQLKVSTQQTLTGMIK